MMKVTNLSARNLVIAAVLTVAGIAALATTSLALFTDTETVGANTFTAGTIDLTAAPTSAAITLSAMAPGDQVTAALTITNAGTLELRYAVTSTTTENVMAALLDFTIKVGVTTCTTAGFGTDGTVVYTTGDLGSTTGIDVIGDPTAGSQAGDRTLAASANEVLCMNVLLPSASGNSSQGVTTTASLVFAAEQTSSNP